MSRLYTRTRSDRRKTDSTAGANYLTQTTITYGSAHSPKEAVHVEVNYQKDKTFPSVYIDLDPNIKVQVYHGPKRVLDYSPE